MIIYIYIYIEREREREREMGKACKNILRLVLILVFNVRPIKLKTSFKTRYNFICIFENSFAN